MDDANEANSKTVGYGRPPVGRRFKPGQSGNPAGRPRKIASQREIATRVFAEKQRLGGQPRGGPASGTAPSSSSS